jgi:predicted nucleic acid-binding protein
VGLIEDLAPGPVALDTAVFIYFIEENKLFLPIVKPLFEAIDRGELAAATSALTLMEVLVLPYRISNFSLAERYESLLTRSRGLRFVELNRPLLRGAARLRGAFNLKPPDALQVAAAMAAECQVFLTNDRKIPTIAGLRVVQLKNYLKK